MYLYGASGHSKVIKDILETQEICVGGFIDDNLEIKSFRDNSVFHKAFRLSIIIVSIGVNRTRKTIAERLSCEFRKAIHPSAIVSPSAKIGEGTVVMPGAIINAAAVIGKCCIINPGASIDLECIIGDSFHIAPQASLYGQVRVDKGNLVGVDACIILCIIIGCWSTIGAGAAVVEDVPDHETVVGVLGKVLEMKSLGNLMRGDGKILIINLLQKPMAERSCHAA